MTNPAYAAETALLVQALTKARQRFYENDEPCELVPFRHVELPSRIPMRWQPYTSMLEDYLEQLANEINGFGYHIGQLKAWSGVLPDFSIEDQLSLLIEFVDSIAIAALSGPYALRSRLIFCSTKLSHEAGLMTASPSSNTPLPSDEKIDYKSMLKFGREWASFEAFKAAMDSLSAKEHLAETVEFRHRYHHRVPPRIELGQPLRVVRSEDSDTGHTVYSFGHSNPVGLESLIPALNLHHKAICLAFAKLSSLAREHVSAIREA